MREHVLHAVELFRLDGMQRAHGEHLAVGDVLLQQEHRRRNHNRDDGNCRGHAVARTDFGEELLVDDDRQGVVVFADEHRGAVVGERAHEHHQRAGEQRRQNQRQHDLEDLAHAGAAEALARLDQRIIQILERAGDEHEHQRIELQAHNDDAALEAVDVAELEAECVEQEIGDGSVAAAEHDPCVSADERRAHRADENQDLQRAGEANLHRGHDVGQRRRQQHGNQRHGRGDLEAAPDRALIIFLVEDLGEILPGETAVLADDALAEHADERIEQEQHVEDADADGDDHPQIPANLLAGRFSGHRSQPLSSGWSCRLR